MRILTILLAFLLCLHTIAALSNNICNYKMFPIFAGGSKDDLVNTMEVDPVKNYIYVGGRS